MAFTDKIKQMMKEKHETWKSVSSELHIGKNQLKYWTDKNTLPDGEDLIKLANHFGVGVEVLLEDEIAESRKDIVPDQVYVDKTYKIVKKRKIIPARVGADGHSIEEGDYDDFDLLLMPEDEEGPIEPDYPEFFSERMIRQSKNMFDLEKLEREELFKHLRQQITTLSDMEKSLIEAFREVGPSGQMRIIQTVMNIKDEDDKK